MPTTIATGQPHSTTMNLLVKPFERPLTYLRRAGIAAFYPIKGIWFWFRNRDFWPLFIARVIPLTLISILVYFVLFTFTFLPQFAFLAIFHGWGAWVNAVVLVLGEGLVIIQALFEGFFVDEARVDVFDATLVKYSQIDLVSPHRIIFPDAPNEVKMLGKPTSPAVYTPWSLIQIIELIFCLPLNLIPIVGTPAFIIITGTRLGKLAHYRWFQLRGLTKSERKKEIRDRSWEYIWFGTVAMILGLIPVLSLFFLMTTTVGAAMWAARIEEKSKTVAVDALIGNGSLEHEDVQDADAPPPYSDTIV